MNTDFKLKRMASFALLSAAGLLASCGGGDGVEGSSKQTEGAPGSMRPGIQGELMIGVLYPFTGPSSANYDSRERYIRQAVAEINTAGGVNGKTLGYMVRDSKAGTTEGSEAQIGEYLDLVNAGCIGVIGPLTSGEALLLVPTVLKTGVPMIGTGPSTTDLDTMDRGTPSVFYRLIVSNSFSGGVAAQIARRDGKQTVAIIHSNDSFGISARDNFSASFIKRGGQVLASASFKAGQTADFGAVIAKAMANGRPDAIYLAAQSGEAVGLSKDMALAIAQPRPSLYAASSLSTSQFVSTANASVVEGMTIMGADNNPKRPEYLAFADLFTQAFGTPPDVGISPSGYDAVYLLALAAQAGGSTDRASMAKWLGPVSRPDSASPLKITPGQFGLALKNPGLDWDYNGAKTAVNWDARGDLSTGSFIVYSVKRNSAGQLALVQVDQVAPD
ncbi:branched-chain amino acid ABC transporter substrate-binding protein [Roseateles albus]|uniref:Branched-chain amino acid ABC transporter substrate-binding protein n=1 Tax=Roseateles albus TaxID=2987525 RepID=A0ABT5KFY1_9BURK|nr:branched-chain amino acid ABC transporter substrate-binding protein [Roseateles albus]MDC8772835.1 branched-chain amino acid ABC transporter substrate-binding protein [Roseateles albus]